MKKFSLNLLKVGLLLVIGLCVFSSNEVKAYKDVYMTYYAEPGSTITIQFDGTWAQESSNTSHYKKLYRNDGSGFKESEYKCEDFSYITGKKASIKLPDDIPVEQSFFIKRDMNDYNEIYILGKHILTNSKGGTSITLTKGGSAQLYMKYDYLNGAYSKIKSVGELDYDKTPDDMSYYKKSYISFASSDPTVASVNETTGLITAHKKGGPVTITMTRIIEQTRKVEGVARKSTNEFTATINVNVTDNTPIYNVTLDYNGGKDKDGRSEVTVPDPGGDGKITIQNLATDKNYLIQREGYELTGWKYNKKTYKVGETIEFNGDIKIVAQWEKTKSKEPAKEPVKLQDANGTEFAVGNYVKYTDNTKEGGWNLRKTARGKILGEIKTGTMLEVTEVSTTDICIKVKVLDGDLEGQEGWLTISAKENFEILDDYTPGEVDDKDDKDDSTSLLPGLEEFDFGELSGILDIIWKLVKILIENLPGMIEKASPYIQSGVEIVGGLVSGLMQ